MSTEYFQIDPCGVGSAEIESFGSFFSRFAHAHSVTVSVMSKHIRAWSAARSRGASVGDLFSGDRASPTGISVSTQKYVEMLVAATGCESLSRTTLMALRPALTTNMHIVTREMSWCPACFREHEADCSPAYGRLLWTIPLVRRCHIHRIRLETKCPSCGARQPHFNRGGDVQNCSSCGLTLVPHHSKWDIEFEPDRYEKGCIEIVEAVSSGTLGVAYKDAYLVFVDELGRQLDVRNIPFLQVLDRRFKRPHLSDSGWTVSNPSLLTLLNVCLKLEVSPLSLLIDPVGAASTAVLQSLDRVEAQVTKRGSRPLSLLRRAERRLRSELEATDLDQISTLETISAELGVSEGYLRYRLEPLVLKHGLHRRTCKEEHNRKQLDRAVAFLSRGPIQSYPSAKYPSQDHLVAEVKDKIGVGVRIARKAVCRLLR